ncbi:MAG: hypothetical protein IIC01_09000 [Planctomycetes bacterium]|nr:hypothetical protein [Planctomycetota bacterium]
MTIRLIILVVVAGVLAVMFAVRSTAPPAGVAANQQNSFLSSDEGKSREQVALEQQTLLQRDLPGEEPPEPADLSVRVEVDPTGGKNRLYLYISEAHGYYVEDFTVVIWHKGDGDVTEPEDAALQVNHPINKFLKANETLVDCLELVKPELDKVGGDIGQTGDWEAIVERYGRARAENPVEFPPLGRDACGTGD